MATVTTTKQFDHAGTQRRVQHPLQQVRSYIRYYVILEGLALLLLCAAGLFWIGLACDFGLFLLDFDFIGIYGVDWILELNEMDATGVASLGCRIVVFTTIVIGLLALFLTKVVWRWVREFNDRAVALVLERRFPKELGDRLITAVEMADPKLSVKYGYSQSMLEKTIQEAVDRIKTLPVAQVFNWGRLVKLWAMVGVTTVGMLIVTMGIVCLGSLFVEEQALSPAGFSWRFWDVGMIWTERNVLMQSTYWPRRSQLEIGNFHPAKDDPNDMRIARDDPKKRPDLYVRAIQWVIADRDSKKAPYGWRPMTWADLAERKLVDEKLLAAVNIPKDFADWAVDADELDPALRNALFGENTKSAPATSGAMREDFAKPEQQAKISARNAVADLDQWLDWKHWTVDKLAVQKENTDVRTSLRNKVNPSNDHYEQLEAVFAQLKEKAESPMYSRTIRKLKIPDEVVASFRGESKSFGPHPLEKTGTANKWLLPLEELAESPRFKLRVRGENYFTPAKMLTLVPATQPKSITIDKEEPAYIYYRLDDMDQSPLRGKKVYTKALPQTTTGTSNVFEIPLGSSLTINVTTDRKLHPERSAFTVQAPIVDPNFAGFQGAIDVRPDKSGFSIAMTNITRNHDFVVEFFDEDSIRGERRFKIIRTLDTEPVLGNLNVFGYVPRKPRFKALVPGEKDSKEKNAAQAKEQAELANAYLITRDARIPFECAIKDDYGLVHLGYQYKHRMVDFELVAQGGKRAPVLVVDPVKHQTRIGMIMSNMQYWPGNPTSWLGGAAHLAGSAEMLHLSLRADQRYQEGYIPSEAFTDQLRRRRGNFINMAQFEKGDTKPLARAWEFNLSDTNDGFDVKKHLPDLRPIDLDRDLQLHYLVQIAVQAGDNNVETGSDYIHSYTREVNGKTEVVRVPLRGNTKRNANGFINFIVVSENELLSQIALDEDLLSEKLEAAKEKIDAGMTSIIDQQSKLQGESPEIKNIALRMNEVRTAVASAGNTIREAKVAYENILKEMEVNRVKAERKSDIANKVINRLDMIVDGNPGVPNSSSLQMAEENVGAAHQLLEDDANGNRQLDRDAYNFRRQQLDSAYNQLHRLSIDLKGLLDAMSEGVLYSKTIAMLVTIEQVQRRNSEIFRLMHAQALEELLNSVRPEKKEDKKEPDKKKDEKKDEKKVGRLGGNLGIPLARNACEDHPAFALRVGVQRVEEELRWEAVSPNFAMLTYDLPRRRDKVKYAAM
jgi:hypothetical protein